MNLKVAIVALLLLCPISNFGQDSNQASQPATETVAPDIPGVVAKGTKVELIKDGFKSTEGPVGLPDGSLIFTEIAAGRITKIDKDGNVSTFVEDKNGPNAVTMDRKGRLIGAETVPGHTGVAVIYPKGQEKYLTDNFEGKPYSRPNDLVADKKGGVYFTDPGAGGQTAAGSLPPVLPPNVYYVAPSGKVTKVVEGVERPNGIALSPDEKVLYLNNTYGEYLLSFDIGRDGTLSNRRNFAKYENVRKDEKGINSGADGLAVDSEGRVYVCTLKSVQVFSQRGQFLGMIPMPRQPQNLAFGGPDKQSLYVVAFGGVFKIPMLAQGYKGRPK